MYNDGLTASQRYYRRNREKLLEKKREKYKTDPTVKVRVKKQYDTWRKTHPYEYHKLQKKYREQRKARQLIDNNENVD